MGVPKPRQNPHEPSAQKAPGEQKGLSHSVRSEDALTLGTKLHANSLDHPDKQMCSENQAVGNMIFCFDFV